ncbi:MAG: LPS translocon maturation chaperone LptM [Burkholderiaceae bacterium]
MKTMTPRPMTPHRIAPNQIFRLGIVAMLVTLFAVGTAGCGQRGPLYLPDKDNPDKHK